MALIDNGENLDIPRAKPGESVDIISFVVTKSGWETLKRRIGITSSNRLRILTRLIHQSASEQIEQAGGNWNWHHLPNNHAKAILYHKQKLAILGSFNVTEPSLGKNIECSHRIDETGYRQLAKEFEAYWGKTNQDECAFGTPATWQAVDTLLNHTDEAEPLTEAVSSQDELTDGPREPWPFQEPIIQHVLTWIETEKNADLGKIVTLPTGAGKTLVAAEVIRRLLGQRPQARILWVCHRVELLRQSWKSTRRQLSGSIPQSAWFIPRHIEDESGVRDEAEFVQSQSCQVVFCTRGMLPRLIRYNRQERFELTVVDECHRFHPESKMYQKLYKYCEGNSIPRLGLTATPLDRDKRKFRTHWNTEAMFGKEVTKDDLEKNGFLSRLHLKLTKRVETNYTFTFRKEHTGRESLERELVTYIKEFNNDEVNREVARAWQEYRDKRQRILCFAVTIEHAEILKTKFFAKDDCVRVVHSDMTTSEIRENLEWFKESVRESRMLVSVLMLAEGIDLPKTDCLFMVRPTFSRELYQQMIGRGFRGPTAGGTKDCAIVDFTAQYVDRHGQVLPFEQETTNPNADMMGENRGTVPDEDEDPDDADAAGRISTVRDLKDAVADLQDKQGLTVQDACEELAQELDYKASTLVNYLYTKADDYPIGWEDPEIDPAGQADDDNVASKGYVTRNKLLQLRAYKPQRFEDIASLTDVASSTLQVYCSDQEKFRRWRANNRDKMDQVLHIMAEFLPRDSDAA